MKIILLLVPSYGWLATIEQDGKEVYRGEYQRDSYAALSKAWEWIHDREDA